jgi:hypothetical protein
LFWKKAARASVAGHNDFPVFGFFPSWVLVVRREFCFVCVSFFQLFFECVFVVPVIFRFVLGRSRCCELEEGDAVSSSFLRAPCASGLCSGAVS